jgi:hypothetical protein
MATRPGRRGGATATHSVRLSTAQTERVVAGPRANSQKPCYAVQTMSDRPLSRIRQLVALCMLVGAVVTVGLAISGALKGARSPAPQLASQK